MRGRDKRIVATHDNGKRIVFGKPAFVNGVRALVYEKNNKVEAYIPVEQLYEALYDKDLPTYTLATHVIPRPHSDVEKILPKFKG